MSDIYAASYSCGNAARFLAMAHAYEQSGGTGQLHIEMAMDELRQAATAMGYELIQIKTPAEAHAAALARGRYQDGISDCVTDALGFDGRNSDLATDGNGDIAGTR